MAFNSFADFRLYLDAESQKLTGKKASTHKTPLSRGDPNGANRSWWTSTGRHDGTTDSSLNRNRAYLRSYFAAEGVRFSATGVRFADGRFIRPDKSVMERSLRDRHVTFDDKSATFCFTYAGLSFTGVD